MRISRALEAQMRQHAEAQYPEEACGLLIRTDNGRVYWPCLNAAASASEHFVISRNAWCEAGCTAITTAVRGPVRRIG